MALNALKIQTADLVGKLVAQLSNRPTNSHSAGGDNLTAQEVKERYDAYGHLLKDRFNALVDALVADPAVDTDALANTIQVYLGDPAEEDPMSLSDALAAIFATLATKYALPEGGIPSTDLASAVTAAINGKYVKPGTGIPATDLETDVQTSLGKADTAYQKPSGGIPATDFASAVKAILDSAVSQSEFAPVKALAENADKVLTAANYEAVATMLNAAAKTDYKVGQKILIGAGRVPDLWVYFVHDSAVSYTFTTNLAFQTALENGTLQIGYYALRPLEAKTDLEGYATETYVGNAISGNIDATLSTTGKSADAKAVGDAIDALIEGLVEGIIKVAEADYAESATYAQQADLANQINTDREIEDADTACPPTVFGTVGGNAEVQSGLMKFEELRGKTIKWNQLVQNGNFADTSAWSKESGVTLTVDNNIGTYSTDTAEHAIGSSITTVAGHKYAFSLKMKSDDVLKVTMRGRYGSGLGETFDITSSWKTYTYVGSSSLDGTGIYIYALTAGTVYLTNVNVFDLTDIYGAGNEPSSPSEFFASFPKPYYPYNAGTPLSSKSASLISRKKNQCTGLDEYFPVIPGETYEVSGISAGGYLQEYDGNKTLIKTSSEITSATDITLDSRTVFCKLQATTYTIPFCYILWSTPGETPEAYSAQTVTLPNLELRSAGSAYDVLYQQGGGKRRIGSYTFNGSESWTKGGTLTPGGLYRYYFGVSGMKSGAAMAGMCSKFETFNYTWTDATTDGVVFGMSNTQLYFLSTEDLTVSQVQAIFNSSVTIVFPLATEIDITTTENPGWDEYIPVDNFGTLQFTQDPAQDVPVPQAYFIRYVVNLVEFLDSLFVRCGGDVSKLALVE